MQHLNILFDLKAHKNILIITYWDYQDALIQNYTLPYAKIISDNLSSESKIYLVTLDKLNRKKISISFKNNIHNISLPYFGFGIRACFAWFKNIFKLYKLIKRENISFIHAWCTPAGMIGYILSLLSKKPLIIDSYEPHAEAMVENGEWKKNGIAFKLLFKFEKLQTHRAIFLIATTEGMKKYAEKKFNFFNDTILVKPACVDLKLFSSDNCKKQNLLNELNLENKIIGVYAGKFGGIYLEKEFFDFIKIAENYWGDKFRALILSSHTSLEIINMGNKSKLLPITLVHRFVPHHQIADYIGLADFAITPVKPVSSKRFCSPIKDGEYWALGLPIVITKNISDDSEIIKENNIGSVLQYLNNEEYLESIKQIDNLLKTNSKEELYKKIRPIAEKYRNFEIADRIYKSIYGKT